MDLALDDSGDLAIHRGDLVLVSGGEAVAQRIRIRLRLFAGEWFLDVSAGVPYFERILGRKISRAALLSILREQIESTPGVASIESLAADVDGSRRSVRVVFRVTTDDGEAVEGQEVITP